MTAHRDLAGLAVSDPTAATDPLVALACAVLVQAVRDWRLYRFRTHGFDTPNQAFAPFKSWSSPRHELLSFFSSSWFALYCDLAGVEPDAARKALVG